MRNRAPAVFIGIVLSFCMAVVNAAPAQSNLFQTLYSFQGWDGSNPGYETLVRDADGNLYGTTTGQNDGNGTVFRLAPDGTLTQLHYFCTRGAHGSCWDGSAPYAGLVQGTDGNFYGTTSQGGVYLNVYNPNSLGTVFQITPEGTLTTLHSFQFTDGAQPYGALLQASDGNYYGTTSSGGIENGLCDGCGTIFKMTPAGALTTLYRFCSQPNCADGSTPVAGLVQGSDGSLYGTTYAGGTNCTPYGCGTIFKITTDGTFTTLHSFDYLHGAHPESALIQARDGNFYGTTYGGGNNGAFCQEGCGTAFKITAQGALTTLYSFCAQEQCADGDMPVAGLIQGRDGSFYGTTTYGGNCGNCGCTYGCGVIFKLTSHGELNVLHTFDAADGTDICGGLIQDASGNLYGATYGGGADLIFGSVYRFSPASKCTGCRY